MSSAGHVLDSIKRMQSNRRLQRKHRNAYRQRLSELSQQKGKIYITPDDILRERISYKQFTKRQNKQRIINIVILLIIVGMILFVLL